MFIRSGTSCVLATAVAFAGFLLPNTGRAAIIDVTVAGVVTVVTHGVETHFSLTDTMSAIFSFDSNAMPQPSLILTQALYPGAISGVSFSVGSYMGTAAGGNINIQNDDPAFHDGVTYRGGGLNSASIGTHVPVSFSMGFFDATDAALISLALPTAASDLAGFTDPAWVLLFSPVPLVGQDPPAAVSGVITSITFSARPAGIPEPGTLALFGLCLAGLGFARRRRAA